MRKSSCSAHLPAALLTAAILVLVPQAAQAGWFGPDKMDLPQWGLDAAKTPVPTYAKSADAVVLSDEYLETVDAQGRATEREREAIRILTPQGRQNGVCGVSYDVDEKINEFREWTLTADGKQFQAQSTDFEVVGDTSIPVELSTQKARIVHPPAADVGATVICETEELLAPYQQETDWQIQTSIPVVFQALEVDLPPGRSYSDAWHRFKPVSPVQVAPNHWRWELKNMPALDLREVKSSPDWAALAARMSVAWNDVAVPGTANQWRAIGEWVTKLEAGRPDPSPEIIAQTQTLIAGAPDFYTKLARITSYIQKNIRYFVVMRGIGGWQAHPAASIFRNRYGDCKDKTTLLISMLQVAGIHAIYMPVDDRRGVVDPDAPSRYGDHMITAIEIPADVHDPRLAAVVTANDGKRYLIFDPTNERTPAGNLPSYEQGSYGTLAAGADSQIIGLPVLAPDTNVMERKGAFTLAPDGTLTGSVDTSQTGPTGAEWRLRLKYTDDNERRKNWETYIAKTLPGVTINSFSFTQPDDLSKPIVFHYKLTADNYAHPAGALLLVRPRVVGSNAIPFDDTPRIYPIDLGEVGDWHSSFDIAIPPGYVVEDTPDPVQVDAGFASYRSTTSVNGNILHYDRDYVLRQVQIPAAKAAAFRQFESTIIEDEKDEVILRKK